MTEQVHRFESWIRRPSVILVTLTAWVICLAIGVSSFTIAWEARTKTDKVAIAQAHLAQQQAALAQQQTADVIAQQALDQEAFCGWFEPIAAAPLPPNVSSFGKIISKESAHTVVVLGCPPAKK